MLGGSKAIAALPTKGDEMGKLGWSPQVDREMDTLYLMTPARYETLGWVCEGRVNASTE